MAIDLYWGSGSGPAWRALLALQLKGVPYNAHLLSFSKRETRTPEHLARNPRGKVPVLVDGDTTVSESLAVLAYLDRRFPEPPLFGQTAAETGQVWRLLMEHENHVNPAFSAVYRPLFFGSWEKDPVAVREAIPAAVAEIQAIADQLAASPFLVGDRLSAADLVTYIGLRLMDRAATRPAAANFELGYDPLCARFPVLAPWARTIEAIPGFEAVFPPHWREGDHPTAVALR